MDHSSFFNSQFFCDFAVLSCDENILFLTKFCVLILRKEMLVSSLLITRKALGEPRQICQAAHSRILQKKVLEPDGNPEDHQNVIICSLSHYQHLLKISLKSVHNFWSYLAKKQTNKQINAGKNIRKVPQYS